MQKWEYLRLYTSGDFSKPRAFLINGKPINDLKLGFSDKIPNVDQVLSLLGHQEWELVNVACNGTSGDMNLFFKRLLSANKD